MVRWRTNDVQNGVVRVDTKQLSSLIRQEPISKYYNVEQPPFAVGAFASVCRVQHLQTGGEYAAKFCQRKRSGLDSTAEIHHEIALLSLCSPSPRIVRLHDVFQTTDQFVIIMEYAPGGDMQTIIDNNIVPFEADVVRFVQHVVEGLSYLHHRRIAHLDIKPQNLVLMGDFPHCDVKVCDFEISRVILDGSDIHEILGTPEYVAPEILHYEPITLAADMWSLGVTVYVLLTGFSPFGGETDQETFLNISRAQLDFPDELFDDVSEHAKDFIAKLLKRNPKDRMTAKQCLRHPWLANNKTRRYRRRQSKTTTTTSGGPTTSGGGTTATATNSAGGQLRKYLSKSREALFERVVAKHQQTSHGNRSRYDRTRRLCESQMSLVSRSREQLLLTGTKRCLSRDKLYGIRHLSKSHEVLNSLAEALVVKQLDGDKVGPATNQQSKSDVTASSQTAASPLQTVLTLICDSKNNNNDDKEQTKENGSSSTSAANNSQPKAVQTGSTPSTPETESKVLIAIEKLQQAINEKNNNRNKDNNRTSLDENKPTNSPTKTAQRKISLTDDHNRTLTTKTADQRKISLPDDHHKTQTITKTGDQRKISLTSAADDNKSQTSTKAAELNRNSSSPSTADQNKTFTTSKTADLSRNTPTTQRKRFTVSKTADLNRFSSNTDQNKTFNTDQTRTCLSRTAQLENSQSLVADQSNKSVSSISSLSTTAEQHSKPTSKTADLKKMSSSSTSDQDNCSSPATKTADQPKILIEDKSADISKNRELSVADQSKMPTRPSRLLLNRQTSSQSADFKQTLTQSADSKQMSPQSADSKQISPQSAESKQISPQSADVRQPYHQSVDLRKSSSQLTDSKELSADPSQTSSQSADLNSPVGGPNSLSPDGWEPTSLTSSEEADVSEPDSSSHQSTWQRQLEEDEPRFTVAQLVSAFNKHQALVTKTSLEVTMNIRGGAPESKILPDEISNHTINRKFPIGPDALRLFIPGIKISEHNPKKSPPSTPPLESLEKSLSTKSSELTKKSPTTPPACENIEKIPPKSTENDKIDGQTREKQRKISSTTDKSGKIADKPTLDCSSVNTADFSPPTPPPPPPAPSSSETRNYKEFASRPTTRHRTSGRQATTLAASSKIRKKSNTTPKPPPFY